MIILPKNSSTKQSLAHHSIQASSSCLGVVLAGGLSSRMRVDKASLQHNETNMLNYSKQLLTQSGIQNVVISGVPSIATQQDIVVADKYKEAGPMGGIASVIEQYNPSALLIVPVDLPLMTANVLQKLKTIGELSQQACYYNESYLPLYLPINAHTQNFLNNEFMTQSKKTTDNNMQVNSTDKSKNGPSIRALLKQIPHEIIDIATPESLINTNTPEEWAEAKKRFTQLNISQSEVSLLNKKQHPLTYLKPSKNNLLHSRKNYV